MNNRAQPYESIYSEAFDPVYAEIDEPIYAEIDEPIYAEIDKPIYAQSDEPIYAEPFEHTYEPVYIEPYESIHAESDEPIYSELAEPLYSRIDPKKKALDRAARSSGRSRTDEVPIYYESLNSRVSPSQKAQDRPRLPRRSRTVDENIRNELHEENDPAGDYVQIRNPNRNRFAIPRAHRNAVLFSNEQFAIPDDDEEPIYEEIPNVWKS